LSAVFADKKQPKQVGKMPEIRKSFNFAVLMKKFFEKYPNNPQSFKPRTLVSNLKSRVLVLKFFMTSRFRSFPGLGLDV